MSSRINSTWKNAVASTFGNMMEWYDFIIFGFLSVLISKQFFPASDPYAALLFTTATFGAGFFFRPIGGILLGLYADRFGRRNALLLVILLMTVSTAVLAFTPSYNKIGLTATVLVVLSRILQGISAGGEFGAATSILVEHAPEGKRFLYGSWQMFAQCFGAMLSALMGTWLTSSFSTEALESWAWRIPFFVGLLIAPFGLYMRRNMTETEAFIQTEHKRRGRLMDLITGYPSELFISTAFSGALNVMAYVIITYLPIYAVRTLGLPITVPFKVLVVALFVRMITIPLFGAMADRIGGELMMRVSLVAYLIFIYPCYYWIVNMPSMTSLMVSMTLFAILMGAFSGPISTVCADLFPVEIRSTGLSLSYNIGAALLGGVSPFVLTWLLHTTGDQYWPAHYCAFFFALGLLGSFMLKRMYVNAPLLKSE